MRGRYFFARSQVRDGPCHPQDALMRARRQVESIGGTFEQRPPRIIQTAVSAEILTFEPAVGDPLALQLDKPRGADPFCNGRTVLCVAVVVAKYSCRRAQDLHVQVDAIQ